VTTPAQAVVGQKRWTHIHLVAGAAAVVPMGVEHTFRVDSESARVLVLSTQAGLERLVRDGSVRATRPTLPPSETPRPSPEQLDELFRAHGQFKPLLAGLQHQPSLLHDVTLVLRMRVKGWRRVSGEEELDQSKASTTRLARDSDDCECAQEPELLTFPRTRPCRTQAAHDPPAYPASRT
jgi:hypothetical protein